jgi:4-hydroxybenzoate polyprenyltransferase
MTSLKTYLKLFRAKDWRGYFLMATLGFLIARGFLFPFKDIILFYLIIFLLLAFGFATNECFGLKEDKYQKKRINPVVSREINFERALSLSILPGIFGVALSATFGQKAFLFSLTGALIGFFYSAPPLRTKSRPGLDLISHGLFAGVFLFVLPFLIFNYPLTLFHYLITFSIFYLSLTLELRNHLEDYEGDKKAGLRTFVCVFGYQNSARLLEYLAVFYPLILFPTFLFSFDYLPPFLIFTTIFLSLFLFKKDLKIIKNYKVMDIYTIFSFTLLSLTTIF